MEEMIKLRNVIKNYDLEELLNCYEGIAVELASEETDKEYLEKELFIYKMEIVERFSKQENIKNMIVKMIEDYRNKPIEDNSADYIEGFTVAIDTIYNIFDDTVK